VIVDQLISQSKTASASSEQTGNLAPAGNDGSMTSRWCAADSALGYHWQVDLGQSYALGKIHILWEKSALYQFKIEGSQDNSNWALVLDETKTTNTSADQTYPLAAASARWVRITVTGLPNTNTWASFFEFQVYGH
jgi:alpha-L-fucosidase